MDTAAAWTDLELDHEAAYRAKHDRYGPQIVSTVTGPRAHAVTIRLVTAEQLDPNQAGSSS